MSTYYEYQDVNVMIAHKLMAMDRWTDADLDKAIISAWAESDFYKVYNETTAAMLADIDAFVKSYNYEDCDGMIDYFNVDFYYFGCRTDSFKIVPKTARIKNKGTKPVKAKDFTPKQENAAETANTALLESKLGYTYKITKGEDTRDGSELWVVRIEETLDNEVYKAEAAAMKMRGGYYSKFKHGFIFRFDPTEILTGRKAA